MEDSFDLIVLGGGSGGLAAAKRAAKYGARVALVEGDRVGGTCVIRGCVPKKLLVYGSLYSEFLEAASSYGVHISNAHIDAGVLLKNVREEVSRLNKLHIDLLSKAGVVLVDGWGCFSSPNHISVFDRDKSHKVCELYGQKILIAVGGRPSLPDIPGIDMAWVSDDIFLQKDFPDHVMVVGAGFIACEFACILSGMGVKVTQIVRGDSLLRGFDSELTSTLKEYMVQRGIEINFDQTIDSIKGKPFDLNVVTKGGQSYECGAVLFATGRKPFLKKLGLENIGLDIYKERITVDENHATNLPHIFAVGDVTDRVNLTPVAIDEGRAFADNIFGGKFRKVNHELIASAVFSQPELAMVGLTEEKAVEAYGEENIVTHVSKFRPMSRSLQKSGPRCVLKLVVLKETGRILGCHMLGEHAAEIIQMAAISIGMGALKSDFDRTMALHPTLAEEFVTMS